MPDIFDTVADETKPDIFDQVSEGETISESRPSLLQRLRTSPLGRSILGPTDIEKQAMVGGVSGSQLGVAEIPEAMLKMTSPGIPPVRKAVEATQKFIEENPEATQFLAPGLGTALGGLAKTKLGRGVERGVEEFALDVPTAPLPGISKGKATLTALGVFGAQYLSDQPEVYQQFKTAVSNGDVESATKIAVQNGLGALLLAFGAKHGINEIRAPLEREVQNASDITSPTRVSQPEVRARMGEEAPLRQPGETAGTQDLIDLSARQAAKAPQEAQIALPENIAQQRDALQALQDSGKSTPEQDVMLAQLKATETLNKAKQKAIADELKAQLPANAPKEAPVVEQPVKSAGEQIAPSPAEAEPTVESVTPLEVQSGNVKVPPIPKPIGLGAAIPEEFTRVQQAWGNTALDTAKAIENIRTGDPSIAAKLSRHTAETIDRGKNAAQKLLSGVVAGAQKFKQLVWDGPTPSNFTRWLGKWDAADQMNQFGIKKLGINLEKAVPDLKRQEAIYNWAAADGDVDLIQRWRDAAPEDVRKGYEDALTLTPAEKLVGNQMRIAYDEWFERAKENGMLREGLDNYLKRVVKKRPELSDEVLSAFGTARFSKSFKEAKRRVFDVMVDAENKGIRYDKRIRTQSLYAQSFERAALDRLAARQFFDSNTENGRPFAIVQGRGIPVDDNVKNPSLMVTPYGARTIRGTADLAAQLMRENPRLTQERAATIARERILTEYESINHPAFKDWQWVWKDPQTGRDVFVRGDALIHKSIARQVKNLFVEKRIDWLEPYIKAQSFAKGSTLSLSLFHNVHEAVNALGHLVNPGRLRPLEEYLNDPVVKVGMENGLKLVGSAHEEAYFSEGSGSGGWPERVPGLGKFVEDFKHLSFEDWIPRLKAEAFKQIYERNKVGGFTGLRRTKNLTPEQNAILSARQTEATFGERNYRAMAADPRFRQAMQAIWLAPDFQSAKIHHIAQSLTRYGGEQRMAIGFVAAGLYVSARLLNKALDDDYHWDQPFSVIMGNRAYTLRSLPGDFYHLISNPRSYAFHRLSPGVRVAMESLTKKDAQGRPVDWTTVAKDTVLAAGVPIPLQSRKGLSWKDQLATALGMSPSRYSEVNDVHQYANKWLRAHKLDKLRTDMPESKYIGLKYDLEDGNMDSAKDEYGKLLETTPLENIEKSINSNLPFTGSLKNERPFIQSLSPNQKKIYDRAIAQRKLVRDRFIKMQTEYNRENVAKTRTAIQPVRTNPFAQ